MSEDNNRSPMARRKRVDRLKKIIILVWLVLTIIPIVCCVVLFFRVNKLNQTLQLLDSRLEQVGNLLEQNSREEVSIEQKSDLQEIALYTAENGNQVGLLGKNEAVHKVYLTFDDGPSEYTDEILDILDQYGVKATFFVVGKADEHSQEMLKRIVEEGHSLGMHSYSHKYDELYASVENFQTDFEKLQNYLYEVTGTKSMIYRFPGGSSNEVSKVPMEELFKYLQEQNVTYYDWNVAAGDAVAHPLSVQEIWKNCTIGITERETSIVLMHDAADKRSTVEALPMVIEKLLEMDDTVLLPITEDTEAIRHRWLETDNGMEE